jgi:hypothetical protein
MNSKKVQIKGLRSLRKHVKIESLYSKKTPSQNDGLDDGNIKSLTTTSSHVEQH